MITFATVKNIGIGALIALAMNAMIPSLSENLVNDCDVQIECKPATVEVTK